MNPFREYIANAKATTHLQPPYYLLTTILGFIAVIIGVVAWYACSELIAQLAGIRFDQPLQGTFAIAVVVAWLLIGLPTILYLAGALVAGSVGALMAAFGKLSSQEVVSYALLARYPQSWFKAPGDA